MFQKLLVEFLGTLFFLYVILATGNALAIGLALAVAIMVGGKISGGHFNPAVTVMMVAGKKLKCPTQLLMFSLSGCWWFSSIRSFQNFN